MALITTDEAKTHLNITVTSSDTELGAMVTVACALVEAYADRTWTVGSVTQTFDGGGDTFLLNQSPITALTSVTVDGTALTSGTYDIDLAAGIVYTDVATRCARQNVVIVYAVGAASPPALAKQGALETTRHLWETQRGTFQRNPALSGDEYPDTRDGYSLPRRVQELLAPLRAVG